MKFHILATSLLLSASSVYSQASSSSSSTDAASAAFTGSTLPACNSLITTLNADKAIAACTTPLLNATEIYSNATRKSGADINAALTDSLGKICKTNNGCDTADIRKYLSQIWDACGDDIKANRTEVVDVYDVLYLINPFREAICTTDAGQNYCLQSIASSAATTKRSLVERQSSGSGSGDDITDVADATDADASSNIAFLFLQPTADKEVLCGDCAKSILASYISFETSIPYGVGLSNSPILKGQSDLFKKAKKTCGKDWRPSVNLLAGTEAFTQVSGVKELLKGNGVMVGGIVMGLVALLL